MQCGMTLHPAQHPPLDPIECWFDFGSLYSYLSVLALPARAAAAGRVVQWRPFLLGPVFKALQWDGSPFQRQPQKLAYVMRDLERCCRRDGLPWRQPSVFPRRSLLPMRVAIAAEAEPWFATFAARVMTMNFAEDREIDEPAAVAQALSHCGVSPSLWLEQAASLTVKERLRERTASALGLGLFGAPSFRVAGELFWGHDRLDDALAWQGPVNVGAAAP